jgi:hypothetical protein
MPKFAKTTTVSSDKSRAEIEATLKRYGASHFAYMASPDRAIVAFQAHERRIKFELPMPNPDAREFTHRKGRHKWSADEERTEIQRIALYEQSVRQRWRALLLVIKAKLEAVDAKITTFEEEFLAHIVLPNGQTAGAYLIPSITEAYETGRMPALQIGWDG